MKIAITDANIFIDLLHLKLHKELFLLDIEIHSTYEVYEELNEKQQKALSGFSKKGKLLLHYRGDDMPADYLRENKGLSESDKLVLRIAIKLQAFILTGDGLLRKVSKANQIEIHGIFWLLDKFIEQKLISKKVASMHLSKLMGYNKRLPQEECERRLTEWGR